MKDNVTFLLAAAVVILVSFALIENSKWIRAKTRAKPAVITTAKTPSATTVDETATTPTSNSSNPSRAQNLGLPSTHQDKATTEGEIIWVLVAFDELDQQELKTMKTEIENSLTQSRRDFKNKSQSYAYRFVTKVEDLPSSVRPYYKLAGLLEKPSAEKWNLIFKLERNFSEQKQVTMFERRQFPRVNPLPNHKILHTNSSIAAQMSGFLSELVQQRYEIELSQKKMARPF